MTRQSGHYGYEQNEREDGGAADHVNSTEQAAETVREYGGEALDWADEWLRPVGLSIKERPMACLAVVAGVAFAAGALWKLGQARQQSSYTDDVLGRMSDLSSRMKRW